MKIKNSEKDVLQLIPKTQNYIEYIIDIIIKLPRTEKFNLGNEYKSNVYQMMSHIMYLTKIESSRKLELLNQIDCQLNIQRIYLRIMYKYHWINEKKFKVAIEKIGEIGRILGGIIKYYGKNY